MNYSDTNTIISRSLHNEYESKFSSASTSNAIKQGRGRFLKLTAALATIFTATFFIVQFFLF
ncbi:MAG: hypothetical protein AB8G95_18985 [Anaerolineae bacterium]